ncbi:protein kilB [Streptomyces sp. VB1]|uniref:protein kilB n=1 Tax=Streptomyces sp. VB1 TaxID=2986803 RepID=UPI002241D6EC|nr:protein kilB [Streptomyces sp. VB1]UZI34041.1 protein kilB [Streptomyces sp. VB1]
MLNTIVAVIGTLLGGVVVGLIQHRTARAIRSEARHDQRHDQRRDQELEAVTAFASGVASPRRAMVVLEGHRLAGAAPEDVAAARAETHATRSAIEGPRIQVSILVPSLAATAEEAIRATFDLRDAPDEESLGTLRKNAVTAADQFRAAATHYFA